MTPTDRGHSGSMRPIRAVSFDLFGTLVDVRVPDSPADAVARELRDRGVAVPDDWPTRYETAHVDVPAGGEVSLYEHVFAALAAGGRDDDKPRPDRETVAAAVDAAFDPDVETRPNAPSVVQVVGEWGPVAVLSNSAVPGLVRRALERSALDPATFDAIVASVDCGWRKPDPRAFETVASALDVPVDTLHHVGDDPETDGGITAAGGHFVPVDEVGLAGVAERLEGER